MIPISYSAHCPPKYSRALASGCLDFTEISHGNILQAPLRPNRRGAKLSTCRKQAKKEPWMDGRCSKLVRFSHRADKADVCPGVSSVMEVLSNWLRGMKIWQTSRASVWQWRMNCQQSAKDMKISYTGSGGGWCFFVVAFQNHHNLQL